MQRLAPPGSGQSVGIPPKPWGIPAVLAVLAIPGTLFVATLIASFFVETPDEFTTGEIIANLILTILFKDFLFIGLAAGFAVWRYGLGWQGLGFRPFDSSLWWLPIVVTLASLGGVIVYGLILVGLGGDAPAQEDVESFFDSRAALPLAFVALVVMAPLSEEVFFRGFMFPGLIRPFGLLPAMAVTGLVFGMFHVGGVDTLSLVLPFSAIGALFCWLYYRTGSLVPCIIAHALFNAVGFTANAVG